MYKKILKKIILVTAIFTVAFTVLSFSPDLALAQNENSTPDTAAQGSQSFNQALEETGSLTAAYETGLNNLAQLLSVIVKFLNYLIYPILVMIGGLMDNSLIFGPGVEDRLYLIWSQIRNLINLLFAIALIGVAIYNVLGLSKDGNYSLKTFLPSMVVTLVLINFSFFGVKLLLDAANVATTAVFALPNAVEQGFSEEQISTIQQGLCDNQSLADLRNTRPVQGINVGDVADEFCANNQLSEAGLASFQSLDKNNAALVLAISFGRIHEVLEPSDLTVSNPSFINLVVNLLIVIVLEIAYVSAFFALMAVLIARVLAMWVVTIASPFLVLKLGLSKANIPGMSFLDSLKLDEIFVKHATAPIKIGLAMSIGYMMLDVFQTVGSPSLYFPLGDDFTNVFSGVSSIHELFVAVAAIGIIWKVSFSAADGTFAESVTNRYRDFMNGLGRSVRDTVIQKAPIVPLPSSTGGGNNDSLTLSEVLSQPQKQIQKVGNMMSSGDKKNRQSNNINDLSHSNVIPNIISASSSSKLDSLNEKELDLLTKYISIDDNSTINRRIANDKKGLIRTLKRINSKPGVMEGTSKNELESLLNEIEENQAMSGDQILNQSRRIFQKRMRRGRTQNSPYRLEDYKEEREAQLDSSEENTDNN